MKLPGIPNPWVIVAVLLSIAVAAGGGYYKGRVDKAQSIAAQELRDKAALDVLKGEVGNWLAKYKGKITTINNEAIKEIRTNTVYTECLIPEEMQKLIMQARDPKVAE